MTERVYIETDAKQDEVQAVLAGNGITVSNANDGEPQGYPNKLAADVPDSRDAVDEVTEKLNDAGITAYVYQ